MNETVKKKISISSLGSEQKNASFLKISFA